MARRTKKIGISGKFGPRYGLKIRKQIKNIEDIQKKRHSCPKCKYQSVKRLDTSIWKCKHCGLVFAGGAYQPFTKTKEQMLRGR